MGQLVAFEGRGAVEVGVAGTGLTEQVLGNEAAQIQLNRFTSCSPLRYSTILPSRSQNSRSASMSARLGRLARPRMLFFPNFCSIVSGCLAAKLLQFFESPKCFAIYIRTHTSFLVSMPSSVLQSRWQRNMGFGFP